MKQWEKASLQEGDVEIESTVDLIKSVVIAERYPVNQGSVIEGILRTQLELLFLNDSKMIN